MNPFRTKSLEPAGPVGTRLRRTLGPVDLIMIGLGAMIGIGIFVVTGTGAVKTGPSLWASFVVAAVACGLVAMCYAEFASTAPVAGSTYTYSYLTLGEFPAWLLGWAMLLEYGIAGAAVAVGWSGYLQSLLGGFGVALPAALLAAPGSIPGQESWINVPACLIVLLGTWALAAGGRSSATLNNAMVVIKVAVILLFVGVGMWHVEPANWQPMAPFGATGVLGAAALCFFAYIGFDVVSSAAEETRRPERNLPIGIIGSLAVCALLYVAVSLVMTGIVPYQEFAGVANPLSLALQRAGQSWVAGFIDLGAVLGMTAGILVLCYAVTRLLLAMSRDGLLPARLSRVDAATGAPRMTSWLVGVGVALLAGFVPLDALLKAMCIGTLVSFGAVAGAVLVLRRTHPDLPRSFRCPWVPVVPIVAIAGCVLLVTTAGMHAWITFGIWMAISVGTYFLYAYRSSKLNVQQAARASRSQWLTRGRAGAAGSADLR